MNGLTGVTGPTESPAPFVFLAPADVVARLADEGIPVRAIARATALPSPDVREILDAAMADGTILSVPRDDWPPGARNARYPGFVPLPASDQDCLLYLIQLFSLTRLEASMLSALIQRRECRRDAMHKIIEQRRPNAPEQTDQKMVDVMICKLRKKLKPHDLKIKTMWSIGYMMPPEDRRRASEMLKQWIARNDLCTEAGAVPVS